MLKNCVSRLLSVKATTAPPPCTSFRCSLLNPLSLGVPVCSMGIKNGARFPRVLGRFSQFTFIHRLEFAIWEALYNIVMLLPTLSLHYNGGHCCKAGFKMGVFLSDLRGSHLCLYFIYFLFLRQSLIIPVALKLN